MSTVLNEDFDCPSCHLQYCISTGDPRMLYCGHCLCVDCLRTQIGQSAVKCGECQSEAFYVSTYDTPVSYTLKAVILNLWEKQPDVIGLKTFNDQILINLPNEEARENLASVGTCTEHNSPLHFGCLTCEQWLCGTCVCLKHSSGKTICKVALIHEAIQQKKEELRKHLVDRNTSLGLMKSETKFSITTTEELLSLVTEQISLNEKYQNELNSSQSVLLQQEKHLKELDEVSAELEAELNLGEEPEKLKETLNIYFNKKDIFTRKPQKKDIFSTWKHWMSDAFQLMNKANDIYVRWKDWKEEKYLMKLKLKSGEVIMTMIHEDEEIRLIFESSFFNYSNKISRAFIELCYQSTGRQYARITFLLDDSPLAQEFLKCCCREESNLRYTSSSCPSRSCNTLTFGEREFPNAPRMVNLGSKDQYLKPVRNGNIGIYNNFENTEEIDVDNMVVYIHMCQDEESLLPPDLPYISNGEEPKLKNSFGSVYDGFDYVQYMSHDATNTKMFVSDCGAIADYVSEDEEDY